MPAPSEPRHGGSTRPGIAEMVLSAFGIRLSRHDHRHPGHGRACAAEHAGDTGIVLALRHPPAAPGLMPHRAWSETAISVDNRPVTTMSHRSDAARWCPTEPGRHLVEVHSGRTRELLAHCWVDVVDGPVVVAVVPRHRRGIVPGMRGGWVRAESGGTPDEESRPNG